MQLLFGERLRPVVGYEALYLITDHGRVWALERHDSRGRLIKGKRLALSLHEFGYLIASLNKGKAQAKRRVHVLVAQAFLENPRDLPEVHHKDHNRVNNLYSNLEWVTRLANLQYAQLANRTPKSSSYYGVYWHEGKQHWRAVLNHQGRTHHLGSYKQELEAARAYNLYIQTHGLPNLLNSGI